MVVDATAPNEVISNKTKYHRLIWDSDPSTRAVIGFSPNGTIDTPELRYGYSAMDESSWVTASITNTRNFNGLTSHFIRLDGLTPDSSVYYKICDTTGCSQRYWFNTASATSSDPYVFIAGGDTRTGWTTRRNANKLIAKIRPLFIMHGGDFTNANNKYEMETLLGDFQLMYSDDIIGGRDYKRIYPMITTMGNHEHNNYRTLCEVFGVDYNQNGLCDQYDDTYGAFDVSPLLRVYTLNSEFRHLSSTYRNQQNIWFSNDITSAQASAVAWRIVQYHKPMYPHYSGKLDNTILFDWWADDFYNHNMNLIVESDTHMCKTTKVIRPNANGSRGFETAPSGGSVYVGEGSWGAGTRSANDAKSWTQDLESINQFKVITIYSDKMEIRTAKFDGVTSTLSREDRITDSTLLPTGVSWWAVSGIGDTMTIIKNATGKTILDPNANNPLLNQTRQVRTNEDVAQKSNMAQVQEEMILNVSEDTFISEIEKDFTHNASHEALLVNSQSDNFGKTISLIKFDLSQLPKNALIVSASMKFNIFGKLGSEYGVYTGANLWNENTATWSSVGGEMQLETEVAKVSVSEVEEVSVEINKSGIDTLNSWLYGNSNTGMVISSQEPTDLRIDDRESLQGATLKVIYTLQK